MVLDSPITQDLAHSRGVSPMREVEAMHTLDIDDELDWRIVEHLMRDRERVASDV